jgi:hypothetical protein
LTVITSKNHIEDDMKFSAPAFVRTTLGAIALTLGASAMAQPVARFQDYLENVTDQHAVLMNRTRQASMASLEKAKAHVEKLLAQIPGRA